MRGRVRGWRARICLLPAITAATGMGLAGPPDAPAGIHAAAGPADPHARTAGPALAGEPGASGAATRQRVAARTGQTARVNRLRSRLGPAAAGAWLDRSTGRFVVDVTDRGVADRVRAGGARPRVVRHSSRDLRGAKAELDRLGRRSPGDSELSWGVDVRANAVVIRVPRVTMDARTRAFLRRARATDPAVRVERVTGAPRMLAFYGGQAIHGGGARCSAGFIVAGGGSEYVLTAGHCTQTADTWSSNSQAIGPTAASDFPGDDFGLIEISDPASLDPRGAVLDGGGTQDITGAGSVPVGSAVCKTGSSTGTTCGEVLAYDVTVNYPSGTVYGLTETDVCARGGDSGGPLFAGDQAQGTTSGGTTASCGDPSFRAYFQPVGEALRAYGVSLR